MMAQTVDMHHIKLQMLKSGSWRKGGGQKYFTKKPQVMIN